MSDYVTKTDLDEALRKQTDEIADIVNTLVQAFRLKISSIDPEKG